MVKTREKSVTDDPVRSPLGSLPLGWRLARLEDITTKIGSGATPRGGESVYLPNRVTYSLIRSQNVFDRHFSSEGLAFISDEHAAELAGVDVKPGDVLLNITGDGITFARACLVPEEAFPARVNQHVAIVRPDSQVCSPGYLISYLTHPLIKPYMESFNAGGSRRAITKGHIESFLVPLPPLAEQQAIAHILGTLDDKIELNRRMNQTLEAIARALFRSWFVDFDPVRAKADGRQPEGMDAETTALFPDGFVDSQAGEVPTGWSASTLGTECDITMGQSPPGSSYNEEGIGLPFFQGRADFGFRFPRRRVSCTAPTRFARPGDTLVSVRAPVGDINMALEDCAIGRGVAAIRYRSGSKSYTYQLLRQLRQHFDRFESEGTVFGSINKKALHDLTVVAPSPDVVERFNDVIEPLDDMIENNERNSQAIAQIRDALLPKLLSGELRVREVDDSAFVASSGERFLASVVDG